MTRPPRDPDLQLAGMALRNGVLMLGPTSWTVALRDARTGEITTVSQPRPTSGASAVRSVPLLRGPVALANMLRVLPRVRRAVPGARLGFESREMLAGTLAAAAATRIARRAVGGGLAGELVAGSVSLAITFASMRSGELACYHGAEHKAIGGYELERDSASVPREHPRCGTQLALPMLTVAGVTTQLLQAANPGGSRGQARAIGQLVGVAAATELFRLAQSGRGGALVRGVQRAGFALQRHATTAEPTPAQLQVADAALTGVLHAEATR